MTDPVLEVPFSGGIDQSTREEILDAAHSFVLLENVRQTKKGGAYKRAAYRALGNTRLDASSRSVGRRLFAAGDQMCAVDDTQLDVYAPSVQRWIERSRVPEAGFHYIDVPSYSTSQSGTVVDTASVNGYIAIAEQTDLGFAVTVLEDDTGAVVSGPIELVTNGGAASSAGLAVCESVFVLVFADSDSDTVSITKLDVSNAAGIAAGWIALDSFSDTDLTGTVVVASRGATFALVYTTETGTFRAHARVYDTTTALQIADLPIVNTPTSIDISEGSDDTIWVCWAGSGSGNVAVRGLDAANIGGTPHAPTATILTLIQTITYLSIAERGHGLAVLMAQFEEGTGGTVVKNIKITAGAAVADGGSVRWSNAFVTGRPFVRNGRTYAWFSSRTDSEIVLGDCTGITTPTDPIVHRAIRPIVVPIVRGLAASRVFLAGCRCRTSYVGDNRYAFAFSAVRTGQSISPSAIIIDFDDPTRWSAVSHHGNTFLTGGVTTVFDGSTAVESNFVLAPPSPTLDTTNAGTLTFTNGGRRYVAVYVAQDAAGNLNVSGVSTPSNLTGNITAKKVVVQVLPLAVTARAYGQVQAHVYATEDGGEEPYHFVGSVTNNPNGSISVIDDGFISNGALLYGSGNLPGTVENGQPGGPQDHRAPPGLTCLTSFNGMLCGIVGNEVWHTAQSVYGEGTWWSPLFTAQFDEKPVALFAMDGTLYALTTRGVYALTGDPPNDAGTQGGLSTPRRLGVERGCINPRSVVVTGAGAFYQSPRGYELFRAGAIEPIGDLVQDELAAFPNVTSAVFDTTRGLVRITLAANLDDGLVRTYTPGDPDNVESPTYPSGGGRDLVFDLILGVWVSVDRKFGSSVDQASQDAAIVNDAGTPRYAWIAADGTVYLEDPSTNLDPETTWVTQRAETGWIHIAGLQGEQFIDRVLVLAKAATSHDLTVSLAFDYGDYSKTRTFTSDQIDALLREWLDVEVNPTTSQAVRVKLEDATPSGEGATVGTGEGATWVALTFNGQPHRGAKRTAGAQRSG